MVLAITIDQSTLAYSPASLLPHRLRHERSHRARRVGEAASTGNEAATVDDGAARLLQAIEAHRFETVLEMVSDRWSRLCDRRLCAQAATLQEQLQDPAVFDRKVRKLARTAELDYETALMLSSWDMEVYDHLVQPLAA